MMSDIKGKIIIPGDKNTTLKYCVDNFIEIANTSIKKQGYFAVALSGGSTPKAIYQSLALPDNRNKIDWSKVLLFWSDERSVPPSSDESNYHMAMAAGFSTLPLKKDNVFRMQAEDQIEVHAENYEKLILSKIPSKKFDAVLLGMGDDGHTASLFPGTDGLHVIDKLVIANHVPQKNTWRMTLTYKCINEAQNILIYVLGKDKAEMVQKVFSGGDYPIRKVGTAEHPAKWIMDEAAGK